MFNINLAYYIRYVSRKFQERCHKTFISNPISKLRNFPFKAVLKVESGALVHLSLPLLNVQDSSRIFRGSVVTALIYQQNRLPCLLWISPGALALKKHGAKSTKKGGGGQLRLFFSATMS